MINKKFNRWTVISEAPSRNKKKYWLCKCDCGTIREVCGSDLRNNKSKSCGCLTKEKASEKKNNLKGQKFGRLIVLEECGRNSNQAVIWKCQCECGNIVSVRGSDLSNGHTKSCGCLQKEKTSLASRKELTAGIKINMLTYLNEYQISNNDEGGLRKCQCDCGNIIWVSTKDFLSGHVSSCGCRKISKGEGKIIDILDSNGIEYIKEFHPETLSFNGRFDFYLPQLNTIIEYDGRQHFIQGNGVFDNAEKFSRTQEYDLIKNNWCKDNNIKLIRIPYTHYNNICIKDLLPETSEFQIDFL